MRARNKARIMKMIPIILFFVGWGITIHAVARELYDKGGYAEILKPQGEWIGLTLMMAGFVIIMWHMRLEAWLRKAVKN